MRIWIFVFCFAPICAFAQLGSKMDKIISFIGADQIVKTEFKSGYMIQDIKTGPKEITTVYYGMDSTAVLISIHRKDSFFLFRDMVNFQKANIPKYRAHKKFMEGTTTYNLDTLHQILFLINYNTNPMEPSITGFAATTDKNIINAWTSGKTGWIKE